MFLIDLFSVDWKIGGTSRNICGSETDRQLFFDTDSFDSSFDGDCIPGIALGHK